MFYNTIAIVKLSCRTQLKIAVCSSGQKGKETTLRADTVSLISNNIQAENLLELITSQALFLQAQSVCSQIATLR